MAGKAAAVCGIVGQPPHGRAVPIRIRVVHAGRTGSASFAPSDARVAVTPTVGDFDEIIIYEKFISYDKTRIHVTDAAPRIRMPKSTVPVPPPTDAAPQLDHQTVGARLRDARKSRGLTLAQLSERSGIAVSTISKAERGDIALTYDSSRRSRMRSRSTSTRCSAAPRPPAR